MDPAPLATLVALVAVVVVGLVAGLAVLLRGRRRLAQELSSSRADLAAVQARLEQLAATVGGPTVSGQGEPAPDHQYLITSLDSGPRTGALASGPVEGTGPSRREFATLALSESVVRVASLAHGVRRALSAENRNRIRFEMRREIRRSRKRRRLRIRETRRHLRAQDAA